MRLLVALVFASASWFAVDGCHSAHRSPVVIQEDDPGWNCRTMGNLQCGMVTP